MGYYPKKTQAKPRYVEGVRFDCWQTGISRSEWRSEDGRLSVRRNFSGVTYRAYVGDEQIGKRYLTEASAMRAAVKNDKDEAARSTASPVDHVAG